MAKAVWLGIGAAVVVMTGIGLRYGIADLSRPPVSGQVPARQGLVMSADDPAAPFAEVLHHAEAFADAVSRAGWALLSPHAPLPVPESSADSASVSAAAEAGASGTITSDTARTVSAPSGVAQSGPAKPDPKKPEPAKPQHSVSGASPAAGVSPVPPEPSPVAAVAQRPDTEPAPDLTRMAERLQAASGRAPVSAPIPDAPPLPPPGVTAFAPGDQYPLTDWTLDYGEAGYLARLTLKGDPLAGRRLGLADTVEVAGWAGDSLIGIRFSHVLAAVCGRVVGVAPVQEPTPDIGRTIHANLSAAGWSLRLPVELLPRCDRPVLTVLAVRDGKFAYPLRGEQPLLLPPETVKAPAAATTKPLRPGDLPFLERQPLALTAKTTTVRRCGASDCAPVGSLSAGEYSVAVLDRQKGWALLVTPTLSGWVPDSLLRPAPPPRKPAPVKSTEKPADTGRPEEAKPEAKPAAVGE